MTEPAFECNISACKLSINPGAYEPLKADKPDINLQNHQYSNHTPKFSLNKRVWLTKLLIISVDAGAKIACGWGTENYYISSDGLIIIIRF